MNAIEQVKDLITSNIEKIERIVIAPVSLGQLITAELHKALTLLEQAEPPAGEFTKGIEKFFASFPDIPLDPILSRKLVEACHRLDAKDQEIERLSNDFDLERQSRQRWQQWTIDASAEIDRLTAKNAALKSSAQAQKDDYERRLTRLCENAGLERDPLLEGPAMDVD